MSGVPPQLLQQLRDPRKFLKLFWPDVKLYQKQWDMIYAVKESAETYVLAGNQLGKDFVTGFIATGFFVNPMMFFDDAYVAQVESRRVGTGTAGDPHTRRIITTSVTSRHLSVLWGEVGRFVRTAKYDLGRSTVRMLYQELRLRHEVRSPNPMSYCRGLVYSEGGEGLAGHHAAYTLAIGDESTGLGQEVHKQFQGWARRKLYFSNPNPVDNQHFFRSNWEAGDLRVDQAHPAAPVASPTPAG